MSGPTGLPFIVDRDGLGQGHEWRGGLPTGGIRAPGAAPTTRLAVSGAWEGPVGNPGWRSSSLRGPRGDVAVAADGGLAQWRAVEGDAVGVVHEPIEDGVGEGGLATLKS